MSFHSFANQEFITKELFASFALAAAVAPVWVTIQTVILAILGVTYTACPITVKEALSKVEGASKVDAGSEKREIVVIFDSIKASVRRPTKTTADADYPSSVKQ